MDKNSIIYVGFKNYNFNIVLPVFITESPLPFLLGLVGFGLAYLYRYKKAKSGKAIESENRIAEKKEEERLE